MNATTRGLHKVQAAELQLFWDRFFTSPEYRENLKSRILEGSANHMEVLLHHMTYGKPKETLDLTARGDGIFVLQIGDRIIKAQMSENGETFEVKGELAAAKIIEATATEEPQPEEEPEEANQRAAD